MNIKSMIQNKLQNKFVNNTIWIIAGRMIQMGISLIVSFISARYLGPSNYGMLNYSAALITFFTAIANLGLNGILVNEIVQNREKEGEILGTGLFLRLFTSALSVIMVTALSFWLNGGDRLLMSIAFLQSVSLVFSAFELLDYWYQSHLKSKIPAIIKIIASFATAAYKIWLLASEKSVQWFAFTTSLEYTVLALFLCYAYFRDKGMRWTFSWYWAKRMLSQSYHFIISGIMVTVYMQIDKLMIGRMLNTEQVGYYAAASFFCTVWGFVPGAVVDSARPILMKVYYEDKELFEKRQIQLYSGIIWLTASFALVISLVSPLLVRIAYGKDYMAAAAVIPVLVWYCVFAYLGVARGPWMLLSQNAKYEKVLSLLGALTNMVMNYLLIPRFGIIGAAVATLITQMSTGFVIPLFIPDLRVSSIQMLKGLWPGRLFGKNK